MLLILHQGAIGDFMLTLSVAVALREHLRASSVEVIASAPSARWAAQSGLIDAHHSPESVGLHTLFAQNTPLDDRLTQLLRRATVVASFLGGTEKAIHARLVNATTARVVSVDPRPKPATLGAGIHITDQWAADIREQGLPIAPPVATCIGPRGSGVFTTIARMPMPASSIESTQRARSGRLPTPSPSVIIHPGSGGRHKCWPVERFVELADALARDGVEIAWMLGPAERERAPDCCAVIANRVRTNQEGLIQTDDLSNAADRIRAANLYVGNDGGMTHIAAATGVPTVAIYVATDPCVWRPLGDHIICIRREMGDSGGSEVYAAAHAMVGRPTSKA